jgi:hypothetical protein
MPMSGRRENGFNYLIFSRVGETEQCGGPAIHKREVAEFYQYWCFSATGGCAQDRRQSPY